MWCKDSENISDSKKVMTFSENGHFLWPNSGWNGKGGGDLTATSSL